MISDIERGAILKREDELCVLCASVVNVCRTQDAPILGSWRLGVDATG
jgi:hypothetical protein